MAKNDKKSTKGPVAPKAKPASDNTETAEFAASPDPSRLETAPPLPPKKKG